MLQVLCSLPRSTAVFQPAYSAVPMLGASLSPHQASMDHPTLSRTETLRPVFVPRHLVTFAGSLPNSPAASSARLSPFYGAHGPFRSAGLLSTSIERTAVNRFALTHYAAMCGNNFALSRFCGGLDRADAEGLTPMHYAAIHGQVETIVELVRMGSRSLDALDNNGWTPLHHAVMKGHVRAVEELVRRGSRAIDSPAKDGRTPMHLAAQFAHSSESIAVLSRLGSRVLDDLDMHGRTPMHYAALNRHEAAIEYLARSLGSQAMSMPDEGGETPEQLLENAKKQVRPSNDGKDFWLSMLLSFFPLNIFFP